MLAPVAPKMQAIRQQSRVVRIGHCVARHAIPVVQSHIPNSRNYIRAKHDRAATSSRDSLLLKTNASASNGLALSGPSINSTNTHPAVLAHRNQTLGFGFSAGGLLFPYFVGVIGELHDLNVLNKDTPMAGASAGSLIVASYKSGVPMKDIFDVCLDMCKDLRQGGTRFRLGIVLNRVLEQVLPEDIHERCSGSSYIAVTTVAPQFKALLINQFSSKKDVIETLLTSCHIPFYFNGSPVCFHRSTIAFDGGITNFLPQPLGVDTSVQVSCFPRSTMRFLRNISISPDSFGPWPYNLKDMLPWAFEPASDEMLRVLYEQGRQDARSWCLAVGMPTSVPVVVQEPAVVSVAGVTGAVLATAPSAPEPGQAPS